MFMNKADLIAMANRGPVEMEGMSVNVIIRPSSVDGTDWIEIRVDPINEHTEGLFMGDKWMEHVTDDEAAEIPAALRKYKDIMVKQAEISKRTPLELSTYDADKYNSYAKTEDGKEYTITQYKDIHFTVNANEDIPINKPILLDKTLYLPFFSFWLDHAVYQYKTYRYKFISTGESSRQYANCDVCGKYCSEVYTQQEEKRYEKEDGVYGWTQYNCHSLFGHAVCLLKQRRQ